MKKYIEKARGSQSVSEEFLLAIGNAFGFNPILYDHDAIASNHPDEVQLRPLTVLVEEFSEAWMVNREHERLQMPISRSRRKYLEDLRGEIQDELEELSRRGIGDYSLVDIETAEQMFDGAIVSAVELIDMPGKTSVLRELQNLRKGHRDWVEAQNSSVNSSRSR